MSRDIDALLKRLGLGAVNPGTWKEPGVTALTL